MAQTQYRLFAAAAVLLWGGVAQAQGDFIVPGDDDPTTRVGTRGANFLHIGIGARPQGMGGAVVAAAHGPAALFWNPANIAASEGLNGIVSHMRLYGNSGITNTAAGLTAAVGQGAVGFGVIQYSSGEMLRTDEEFPTGDRAALGTFSWTGVAVSGHYARNVTERLTAAVGVRYAQEGIEFATNSFFGGDISTRFRTGLYGLTIGAALTNIGSQASFNGPGVDRAITDPRRNQQPTGRDIPVSFRTRDVPMPTNFRFGVLSSLLGDPEAYFGTSESHSLIAEVDFSDPVDAPLQTALGVEYGFRDRFFARAGKRWFNEAHAPWSFADGLSIGGGIDVPAFGRRLLFDYAFVTMGELQNNQVFSFELRQ